MSVTDFKLSQLEFKDLSFGYRPDELIFENLNFKWPTKGVVRLKTDGESQGRSTLLKILAGLLPVSSGEFWLNQELVNEMSFEAFLPYRLRIGFGFEFGGLISNKTIAENIRLPLDYHNIADEKSRIARVDELLDLFDLTKVAHLRPFAIAGSQRKAACVARSLVLDPSVLILDEPTVGLNPIGIHTLKAHLDLGVHDGKVQLAIVATSDSRLLAGLNYKTVELRDRKLFDLGYETDMKEAV